MKREDSSMNVEPMSTETTNMASMSVQKNKKRGNTRRFLLLVILLICTVALLGGATYAWFTANTKVAIEEFQLQVTVAKGIEISSDAKSWGPLMSLQDLYIAGGLDITGIGKKSTAEDAGAINQLPGLLENVSSLGNISTDAAKTKNSKPEIFTGIAAKMCWVWDDKDTKTTGSYKRINGEGETGGANLTECDTDVDVARDGLVESVLYEETTTSCAGSEASQIGNLAVNNSGSTNPYCGSAQKVIAFDMYLKLDEEARVFLADGSYVKESGQVDYGLKNTIRVAFVTLGTQPAEYYFAEEDAVEDGVLKSVKDKKAAADQSEYNLLDTMVKDYYEAFGGYVGKYGSRIMNTFGEITIWEPSANYHNKTAILHASNNYKKTITNGTSAQTDAIWAPIVGTRNVTVNWVESTTTPDTENPGKYIVTTTPKSQTVNGLNMLPMYMYQTLSGKNATGETDPYHNEFFAPQLKVTNVATANSDFQSNTGTSLSPYKNLIGYEQDATDTLSKQIKIFTAPAGVTKLRVYIWVEGSDLDTENTATSSLLDVGLMFTTADPTGTTISDSEFTKYAPKQTDYGKASGATNMLWRTNTDESIKHYEGWTA